MNSLQAPRVARYRTVSALLATIAEALNEGACVEPGSIDTHGMNVLCDGVLYRLSITDGDTMDDADWVAYVDRRDAAREAQETIDRDWMADTDNNMPF